jgi:hypothetical protein
MSRSQQRKAPCDSLLVAWLCLTGSIGFAYAQTLPLPGLYRIEVQIELPNVQNAAPPQSHTECLGMEDFSSGRAFAVRSANPLSACPRSDVVLRDEEILYAIACSGPNMGYAKARFEIFSTAFRGRIDMNMGGKNMTMTETQNARRIGECR